MKVLIDELPPQHIWKKHARGTSLADYPVAKHSVSQSNPQVDRTQWTPEPAFYDYSKVKSEGHTKTVTKKECESTEESMASASSGGDSPPAKSRASKIRDRLENLMGVDRGDGGNDQARESSSSANPTEATSLRRRMLARLQRRLKHRSSTDDKKVDDVDQAESSAKARGKRRESEPESDDDSVADE